VFVQGRSTKPFVHACRGLVQVWRMPRATQTSSKLPLNSLPPSVSTRWIGQPALAKTGGTVWRRNAAAAWCVGAGRMAAPP
jgi:hypothetical protein